MDGRDDDEIAFDQANVVLGQIPAWRGISQTLHGGSGEIGFRILMHMVFSNIMPPTPGLGWRDMPGEYGNMLAYMGWRYVAGAWRVDYWRNTVKSERDVDERLAVSLCLIRCHLLG